MSVRHFLNKFQNTGFWTQKLVYDSLTAVDNTSGMESKRSHPWFMETSETDLFPHKKQAVEVQSSPSFLGMPNPNVAQWATPSGFHSVPSQFSERLFDTDSARTINFDDRRIMLAGSGNMNLGKKDTVDPFGNDSSFGLSMSNTSEDPKSALNYSGIRKVKVSQVKESDNLLPASLGHTFSSAETLSLPVTQAYSKQSENTVSPSFVYEKCDGNVLVPGDAFHKEDNSFILGDHPFVKQSSKSVSREYRPNDNTMSIGCSFRNGIHDEVSVCQTYSKGRENGISNNSTSDSNLVLMGQSYRKQNEIPMQLGHGMFSKSGETNVQGANSYKNENNIVKDQRYNKGDNNILSFCGYEDQANSSGRLICNYDLLMDRPSGERPAVVDQNEVAGQPVDVASSAIQVTSTTGSASKKEESKSNKKDNPNSFPSNVRSLLSTNMLDGVPVKYVAWSREKELCGVIKGTGYLCGCQACNLSKVVNAYEFERHAGCKTKHPNNHIYFDNGKTVYGIVQELRSTPQNMLFDVIQTITGSPLNQKSFRLWKESFLAATRELQRIYGKDEVTII